VLLDDRVTIATPEGVSLELVLAGVGSRFMARLLDTVIQLAIIFALGFAIAATSAPGTVRAVVRVLAFLVIFAYDVPFELWNGGRTIGKAAAGIRVTGTDGDRIGFFASATRNIMRIVDFLPVFYAVGVTTMVSTKRDQRLGDLAASTIVVRDRFPGLTSHTPAPATVPVDAVATWDVSAISPGELATIHQFLDRRLSLPLPVRAHFASELANRIGPKVAGAPYGAHPEYLLEGIVVAKQARW
jgi:uncharacterized RDD family membrane protein YckC